MPMSLKSIFLKEMQGALSVGKQNQQQVQFKQEDFNHLPVLIRKFLAQCGYIGTPRISNFFINYEHAGIKLKPEKKWTSLSCQQFNCSFPPTRIALMQSRLYGLVPFAGRDKYEHGRGSMLIKLAGLTVSHATGRKMDQAGLVTYLAETPLLPMAYLHNHITWQESEGNKVKATITDAGNSASGTFYLNDRDEIYEFRTEDRYYSNDGKKYVNWTWSAYYDRYKDMNGIKIPTVIRAEWHMPQGQPYEYFRAAIKEIKYNLER